MKNEVKLDIDEGVRHYFNSLKNVKSLTKEEERELFIRYKEHNDIAARNKLLLSNLKYACKLATSYRNRGVSFSDLISEANYGLIEAIEKFDMSRDVKLITYSKWWIMQKMQSAIEKKGKMPESELPSDIDSPIEQENDDEVAYEKKNGSEYDAFIIDDEAEERKKSAEEELSTMLGTLGERELDMIRMHFGMNGYEECTLDEIGEKYNLTKERVRQIIEGSFKKLRTVSMLNDSVYLSR